ncbi:hypothetical protein RUND412_009334, partial [Rhizina undulata]
MLQKEQEESKIKDKKEFSGYLYLYKLGNLPASMFKLNLIDINENIPEQGECNG